MLPSSLSKKTGIFFSKNSFFELLLIKLFPLIILSKTGEVLLIQQLWTGIWRADFFEIDGTYVSIYLYNALQQIYV